LQFEKFKFLLCFTLLAILLIPKANKKDKPKVGIDAKVR
jgi:hypothetical protein